MHFRRFLMSDDTRSPFAVIVSAVVDLDDMQNEENAPTGLIRDDGSPDEVMQKEVKEFLTGNLAAVVSGSYTPSEGVAEHSVPLAWSGHSDSLVTVGSSIATLLRAAGFEISTDSGLGDGPVGLTNRTFVIGATSPAGTPYSLTINETP
jgi:hypothetical protein